MTWTIYQGIYKKNKGGDMSFKKDGEIKVYKKVAANGDNEIVIKSSADDINRYTVDDLVNDSEDESPSEDCNVLD